MIQLWSNLYLYIPLCPSDMCHNIWTLNTLDSPSLKSHPRGWLPVESHPRCALTPAKWSCNIMTVLPAAESLANICFDWKSGHHRHVLISQGMWGYDLRFNSALVQDFYKVCFKMERSNLRTVEAIFCWVWVCKPLGIQPPGALAPLAPLWELLQRQHGPALEWP